MKIVDRKEFMSMKRCLFAKYEPCIHGEIRIKHANISDNDFVFSSLFGDMETEDSNDLIRKHDLLRFGESIKMSTDETDRDGMFDNDQLFLIFEKDDINEAITALKRLL